MTATKITGLVVKDVRFPTSLEKDGSDAMVSDFLKVLFSEKKYI